jgi:predicted nucleic acid-binding protein
VSVVYDAGVLIAAARGDRQVWADHLARLELGVAPVTTAPVVAQVSRSPRQVQVRRLLRGCEVVAFGAEQGHDIGALLGRARTTDVVDAHVMITAATRTSTVITSDPDDLAVLAGHLPAPVRVRRV